MRQMLAPILQFLEGWGWGVGIVLGCQTQVQLWFHSPPTPTPPPGFQGLADEGALLWVAGLLYY